MNDDDTSTHPGRTPAVWGDERQTVLQVLAAVQARSATPSHLAVPHVQEDQLPTGSVTAAGIGTAAALARFTEVLLPATAVLDHPMALAYVPPAPNEAARAFDALVSVLDVQAALWETGAGVIHAENEVLAWFAGLLGWPNTAGGTFLPGGTQATLAALVTAREQARRDGIGSSGGRWRIACSTAAHPSVAEVARVMDVDVVQVEADDRERLTESAIRSALDRSGPIFAIVASIGTTNAGAVDDVAGAASVALERGCWLHVDAAYGGAALLSAGVRQRIEGLERADSFVVDPHKWLFAPYDSSALLYRDPERARVAFGQHAEYLDVADSGAADPADLGVQLSRRARGLPLWFGLAVHGTDRYREAVELSLATARQVATWIEQQRHLHLVTTPDLSVLLFEHHGWNAADYADWSERLSAEGRLLCRPSTWQGRPVLRLVFVNPATDAARVIGELERMDEDLDRCRSHPHHGRP